MRFEKEEISIEPYFKSENTVISKPFIESNLDALNLNILQENLANCLAIIDDEAMKGYLTILDSLPIISIKEEKFDNLKDIHFFRISEMVYQENEFSADKLAMVFHTLSNRPCTLVLMLKSDGEKTDFYLGARPNADYASGTLFQMLKHSLQGFFPGTKIEQYYDEEMRQDLDSMEVGCISCVTSVADYKQPEKMSNKDFIQGLEKYVYALQGKPYTAFFIADNLSHEDLMHRKREYEQVVTQLSPFANMQMSFAFSDSSTESTGSSDGMTSNLSFTESNGIGVSTTETKTNSEGTSKSFGGSNTETRTQGTMQSVSHGETHTNGHSDSVSKTISDTRTIGMSSGSSISMGFGGMGVSSFTGFSSGKSHSVSEGTTQTDSFSDSISKTLTKGFNDSKSYAHGKSWTTGVNTGSSIADSQSFSINKGEAYSVGQAFNLVQTKTVTDSFGSSKSLTLNAQNMTLHSAIERIRKHLKRIEECESFGMWNFAAYFIGESAAETETAANTYKSVVAGVESGIERNAVNTWKDQVSIERLMPYLRNFLHPEFSYTGFSYYENRMFAVNPAAMVSTKELAIHMGLPRYSVRGLPVVEHAMFGQEIITRKREGDMINIGKIYHMGNKKNTDASLNLNSLTMHTFVTGSTGSGKSNAVYHLLSELSKKKIPFLIIEPAKGEYKNVFPEVKYYGTNILKGELLKINPFSFPDGIHVLEHIDRIIEIFNVCWPMYAAMPAVLKESIENAYKSSGWNLEVSENEKIPGLFPVFDDVLRELRIIVSRSEYSSEVKANYIGSLSTRIKSLTNGINGSLFVSDEMDLHDLFDESAIIDLSRVGSQETKSLIMGLLILKLQEYRMEQSKDMNLPLKHVTVLEEAHTILKRTSSDQSMDGSNMIGKSVEMLTNAIAEIRTYGEGFIIVDQAPNLLDVGVIRNTNTKIVFRLPEARDRDLIGSAMSLKDTQYDELSKLPTGVASVYQNDWQEAVLCSLPQFEQFVSRKNISKVNKNNRKFAINALLHFLLAKEINATEVESVKNMIMKTNISAKIRRQLWMYLEEKNVAYDWAMAELIAKNYDLSEIFRDTNPENWSNLEALANIMLSNMQEVFYDFSYEEKIKILYYICNILYSRYPKHHSIERLRVEFLKEKVLS